MTDTDKLQDIIETLCKAIPHALGNVLDSKSTASPDTIISDCQTCLDSMLVDIRKIRDRAEQGEDEYIQSRTYDLMQRIAQTRSILTYMRNARLRCGDFTHGR